MGFVIHVPHSSPAIPADVRADIALSDEALACEIAAMTDWLTAPLALAAIAALPPRTPRPEVWINPWSRLVIDPERFPDEREPMNAVGMGAVYHRTHDGAVLRAPDPARDIALIDTYFRPYAEGLATVVRDVLARDGEVTILDVHSFPTAALPYEVAANGDAARPALCIGVDDQHTLPSLVERVSSAWTRHVGTAIGINAPFVGTYVPLEFWGRDPRVSSIMIEIRRDQIHPTFDGADTLLASGLLPGRPWIGCEPQHPLAAPRADVVAFLSSVLTQEPKNREPP